jgi:uncharacterized protein YjgD (DUF1641 family)
MEAGGLVQQVQEIKAQIDRLERTIDASGIGLLAELEARRLVEENLALLLSPELLKGLSFLGQALDETPSLVRALKVLGSLDQAGALEFAEMMAGSVPDALSAVLEPTNLRIFGNLAVWLQFLTTLDPAAVSTAMELAGQEFGKVLTPETMASPPKVGLGGLLGALRDPEVQAGLGLLILFLKAFGRAVKAMGTIQQAKAKA